MHPRKHTCAEGRPAEALATIRGRFRFVRRPIFRLPLPRLLEAHPTDEDEHGPDSTSCEALCRPPEASAEDCHQAAATRHEQPQAQEHLAENVPRAPDDARTESGAGPTPGFQRQGRQRCQVVRARQRVQAPRGCARRSGHQSRGRGHQQGRSTVRPHVQAQRDKAENHGDRRHTCNCERGFPEAKVARCSHGGQRTIGNGFRFREDGLCGRAVARRKRLAHGKELQVSKHIFPNPRRISQVWLRASWQQDNVHPAHRRRVASAARRGPEACAR
mmetsp:Transcript_40324/g.115294  ORF Transcript_40324/g.115294 Transcript_40324/m.115294 type:complete len:274 (-) Transcript_40324:216-1037(-)